ncbi:MAG: hypothetical protein ACLRPX_03605 [Ruthenibacterium sp.]
MLDELRKIGKPCFFRAGERGAYMLQAAKRHFASGGHGRKRGPHRLRKCSTATALIGYAEGLGP